MADDPLDSWNKTLAEESHRAALLPRGRVKNALNKKLREIGIILEPVGALAEMEPFRRRVENVARRMTKRVLRMPQCGRTFQMNSPGCVKNVAIEKARLAALDGRFGG